MSRPTHIALRRGIVTLCRNMRALGLNHGMAGNVSARVAGGFLITPSARAYESMQPEDIVLMDNSGRYEGSLLPSSEWRMHAAILRARKDAEAVVHVHSPYATALSCLRLPIPSFHYMVAKAGGTNIRCSAYAPFGSDELARTMLVALKGRRACLLANHGMICFGPDLDHALLLATEVEALAMQYWLARCAGRPVLLSAADMQLVLARFSAYGKAPQELPEGFVNPLAPPQRRAAPASKRDATRRRRAPVNARPRPKRR
ncbi:MAG: class II aldolase [Alphaproteobacteria bacterium]|nr:class II aldolase [Alphaproteobacteria bacterium]